MEKRRPHYSLPEMQAHIAAQAGDAFTRTALEGGKAMNLTLTEMLAVLAGLSRSNFYKSMTTYRDHRVWQDVYHATCMNGRVAYIKLTRVAEQVVIQFKEK